MDSSLIKDLKKRDFSLKCCVTCDHVYNTQSSLHVYCAIAHTCLATTFVINEEERTRKRERERKKEHSALYSF